MEQVAADVGLGGLHLVQQPLVLGQLPDELQDPALPGGQLTGGRVGEGTDHRGHRPQSCLVTGR